MKIKIQKTKKLKHIFDKSGEINPNLYILDTITELKVGRDTFYLIQKDKYCTVVQKRSKRALPSFVWNTEDVIFIDKIFYYEIWFGALTKVKVSKGFRLFIVGPIHIDKARVIIIAEIIMLLCEIGILLMEVYEKFAK